MNKFRASYTVLDMWANGNWHGVVNTYFKLDRLTTPGMEQGKLLHEQWKKYIDEHKRLPDELGGTKLKNPITETKLEVPLSDWLELVGVPDCIDGEHIYEFKTGKLSSENYASSFQGGVYGVLGTLTGRMMTKAILCHYDQYVKRTDVSYVWITDELIKKTANWIETLSAEIHEYFTQNGLYQRYGN